MARIFKMRNSFAGDYSGAVSVLRDLGGMIIFCDAGACMDGFVFSEDPIGETEEGRVFTASLREKQVVMGIDQKLKKDAVRTYEEVGGDFVCLIGTPVSAIIGADLDGIGKEICKELQEKNVTKHLLRNIAIDTNGIDFYDIGQEKAYQNLACNVIDEKAENIGDINVIGATAIDMWDYNQISDCIQLLKDAGANNPVVWGSNGGMKEIAGSAGAKLNIAVSVSGIKTVKYLHEKYGTPYMIGYPFGNLQTRKWKERVEMLLTGKEICEDQEEVVKTESGKRALIIWEQVTANALRDMLETELGYSQVDVASFFKMNKNLKKEKDLQIKDEADLERFLKDEEKYDLIIADPLCFEMIPYDPDIKFVYPHIAISQTLFGYLEQSPNIFGEKASLYFEKILKGE